MNIALARVLPAAGLMDGLTSSLIEGFFSTATANRFAVIYLERPALLEVPQEFGLAYVLRLAAFGERLPAG